MPSIEETRRQVTERLHNQTHEVDHDAILARLEDEIDQHNAIKDDLRHTMWESERSRQDSSAEYSSIPSRFRFKAGVGDPKERTKPRSKHDDHDRKHCSKRDDRNRSRRKRRKQDYPTPPEEVEAAAHPFPREPTDPLRPDVDSQDAFRESLFDALADDEGAAYWESVYSQPIHVYSRPTVRTEKGDLEEMEDEEYVGYVKTKMWEKKHPEVVLERERSARKRKEEEEERVRRREEFVRRKEQAAWERAQRRRFGNNDDEREGGGDEYEFAGDANRAPRNSPRLEQEYASAWSHYLAAWDKLKHDLLAQCSDTAEQASPINPSKRIPWPVLSTKPVIKSHIEDFMSHTPAEDHRRRLQILKAERVRWHPDKVQQRFGGKVGEGTMRIVTGVFQVVDGMVEKERKKAEGS